MSSSEPSDSRSSQHRGSWTRTVRRVHRRGSPSAAWKRARDPLGRLYPRPESRDPAFWATSPGWTSASSAAARPTSPRWLARRGRPSRRRGRDARPARDRTSACRRETGIEFPLLEANAEDVPLPDASFDLVPLGARRLHLVRSATAGSRRQRGCCGRAASSSSCANSTLVDALRRPTTARHETARSGRSVGLHRLDWEDEDGRSSSSSATVTCSSCCASFGIRRTRSDRALRTRRGKGRFLLPLGRRVGEEVAVRRRYGRLASSELACRPAAAPRVDAARSGA